MSKVNSLQEACTKCYAVHIGIKIWNLANHMRKQNKNHQNEIFFGDKLKILSLMFFVSFFSCDLQNFIMWTAKHLVQASCTELTLPDHRLSKFVPESVIVHLMPFFLLFWVSTTCFFALETIGFS